jgi:subtilisin-like proprotein convertase family protein
MLLGVFSWPAWPVSAGTPQAFTNSSPITIPASGTSGNASPSPSNITVSGIVSPVAKVTVKLNHLSHTYPRDLDILLVDPNSQGFVILMSDAGGSGDASNVDLTFDDAATATLPEDSQIISGTYKPTDYPPLDSFPVISGGSIPHQLSEFNGLDPNGTWHLYVVDDNAQDTGSIALGWTLTITPNTAPTAKNDAATTTQGVPVTIDVLANDIDDENNISPATVTVGLPPSHGLTSVNPTNGRITYTPTAGYTGPDGFSYAVKDSIGATSNAALVNIAVELSPTATPTSTLTPTPTPTSTAIPAASSTPTPVFLSVSRAGTDRLQVHITVTGTLQLVRWTAPPNAVIEDAAGNPLPGGALVLPPTSTTADFYVRRLNGEGVTVPLLLSGSFGVWNTFVGAGPNGF